MTKHHATLVALVLAGACASPPTLGTLDLAIVISPISYDFGDLAIGATSAPRLVIISPSSIGFEEDVVDSITESCDDFDLDLSLLDAFPEVYRRCTGEQLPNLFLPCPTGWETLSQQFTVSFHPSFAGTQSCSITINMQSGPYLISVSGTGLAPPVALTLVTPADRDLGFGDVIVGSQSSPLPVTIRSDGTAPLDLEDATITGPDAVAFTLATVDSEPLGQGQTFTWQITCTPAAPTALSATLTITSNAAPVVIGLSCSGIQSNLTVAPSPVQFAETLLGAERTDTVQLSNSGTAQLVITSTQIIAGPFTAPDLGGTPIDPAQNVPLSITFTPTAADVGTDVRGNLLVRFNGGADSRTIDLVGPARDATLSLTPGGAIDFGTVCAGQRGEQDFVALNSGSGGVAFVDASVTGPGFTLMPIAPATYPAPLPARGGGSVNFRVIATPPTGEAIGELTVTTAIPGSAPTVVPLHAVGQASGIGATPLAVDFGGVVVDQPSGGRTVRISNCDAVPLDLLSATVTGEHAGEFVLVVSAEQTLPTTLDPGEDATFIVELRPTTAGDKVATLELIHTAGTTLIPLTGLGVGDVEPGSDDDRGSYYACSAGGGAGLAPIAGALAILLRRRRRARR